MIDRHTRRWSGIVAVVLVTFGVGLVSLKPSLIVLSVLIVGFAVYPHLLPAPQPPEIDIQRSLSKTDPKPGDLVTVTVTIRNDGDHWIPDLRVIDGVPSLLPVVEGSPRVATALAPGEETTIEYCIRAEMGKHRFEPATIIGRNISGSVERTDSILSPTTIDCHSTPMTMSLSDPTTHRPGPIPTNQFGSGVEFYSTREASPGEAIDRIDWRRYARTGELSVIEFRPERAANVIVCVDTVRATQSNDAFTATAARRAVLGLTVADQIISAIAQRNHAVGLTTFGDGDVWIPPAAGPEHVQSIKNVLDTDPAFAPTTIDAHESVPDGNADEATSSDESTAPGGQNRAVLHERVGPRDQLILVSPLLSDEILEAVLAFNSPSDDRVTVLSPQVPVGSGLGGRLTRLARADRIRTLRNFGAHVIDWNPDDELATVTAASMEEQVA